MIIYLSNVLFFYIYVSLREGISPSFLLQNRPIKSFFSTGGGATQIFMISVLFKPMVDAGLTEDTAWRASMAFPAMMMISCAICVKCLCWDMPTGKHYDPHVTGKKTKSFGVGLLGSPQGFSRGGDDFPVLCLFRVRVGHE